MGREKKPEQGAGLPQRAFVYAPPQATPRETDHRTLELKRVQLAPDIDPRRQRTQLLRRGPAAAPRQALSRQQVAWLAAFGVLVGAGTWGVAGAMGTGFWSDASGVAGDTDVVGNISAAQDLGRPASPGAAVRALPLRVPGAEAPGSVRASLVGIASVPGTPKAVPGSAPLVDAARRSAPRTGLQRGEASSAASGALSSSGAPPRAWVLPREPEVWLK
jgi:hypothetical protein